MPRRKPTAAGTTDHAPRPATISIAGMSNDHTDAATITPEAKPNNDFCSRTDISRFIIKTNAEPSIVPSSGSRSPTIIVSVIAVIFYLIIIGSCCKDTVKSRVWQYPDVMFFRHGGKDKRQRSVCNCPQGLIIEDNCQRELCEQINGNSVGQFADFHYFCPIGGWYGCDTRDALCRRHRKETDYDGALFCP